MRDNFTGMIRVNLIGLQVIKGIKTSRQGDIVRAFRPDNINTHGKVPQKINFPIHTEKLVTGSGQIFS
jgi:hypothetical protein